MNPITRAGTFGTTLPLLLISSLALADEAVTELDEVVVTATRTAQTVDETLAATTIITRDDIEKSNASSIVDLLTRYATGVDFTVSGGRGKNSSLFLRGTSTKQTLVLIDGIRAGSATLGGMAWPHLSANMIERVEVVRGPRSSLYGSEAMGGIISITTRKGKTSTWHGSVSLGSDNTKEVTAGTTVGSNKTQLSINSSYLDTDGFDSRNGGNSDADGYDNKSVNVSIQHKLSDKTALSLNALYAKGTNEYDGFGLSDPITFAPVGVDEAATRDDFLQQNLGFKVESDLTDTWSTQLSFGEYRDETDDFASNTSLADGTVSEVSSFFNTKRQQINWQNSLSLGDNALLVLGVDHQKDNVSKTSPAFQKNSRKNTGFYAEYLGNVAAHDYQVSLRTDDDEAFGQHTTGSLSVGRNFGSNSRLTASYGTAFKAPTFNDLYWPVTPFFVGNPDLIPEQSKNLEIGLRTQIGTGQLNTNIFRTDFKNLIAYEFPKNVNIDEARIEGLELEYQQKIGGLRLNTNLTLLNPRNSKTGKVLSKRVKQTLKVNLEQDFGRYSVGGSVLAQGERASSGFGAALPGYSTVDFRVGYKLNKHWHLKAELNNLLDKEYQTTSGFDMLDRNALFTVSYQ